ncbi:helix-turn-helix domain-containing protein [Lactococcus petauri]|uniref:helix-turn-helix domain-containing protein n=1 Tax=Lactococcus petauri TaxID=1940789 RepID=UPI001F56CD05|nr:Rgg/GadR/MutR family transcriptional regulator [Lactococcus petauri]
MVTYKKYGETFKKLRKQRGFKLTNFEHLGVSSSALCKFERGISLLKFDKLVLVLGELSVTLAEYEKCLNDYSLDTHEFLIQRVIIAIVSNRMNDLPELYKEAMNLREVQLGIAIKGMYSKLTSDEKDLVIDYLERITFWRYTDLYTFHLSLNWLELSQISFIIEGVFLYNSEVFNSLEHRNRVTHIICYASMIYASKGYASVSQQLLGYVQAEDYKHTMFTQNIVNFFTGFWESEYGEKEKGIQSMKGALNIFDSLSFPGVSDYYKRLYEKYSVSKCRMS